MKYLLIALLLFSGCSSNKVTQCYQQTERGRKCLYGYEFIGYRVETPFLFEVCCLEKQ